jgi:DNA-binding NarL/FixJ family response regulator
MKEDKRTRKRRQKARVFIVDDHPSLRYGLAQLINKEHDLIMCGEAEDAPEALEAVTELAPDVVILDLSLKQSSGLQLIRDLKEKHDGLPILVLSMHDETVYAERALRAGARGYMMKHEATDRVTDGIRKVLRGELCVSERMAQKMIEGFLDDRAPGGSPSPLTRLSDREIEVLRLTGQGLRTREIAEVLHLSRKTVESHHAKLKQKLNLAGAKELFQFALQWAHHVAGPTTPP